MAPMIAAAYACTRAQPAVMLTAPASTPAGAGPAKGVGGGSDRSGTETFGAGAVPRAPGLRPSTSHTTSQAQLQPASQPHVAGKFASPLSRGPMSPGRPSSTASSRQVRAANPAARVVLTAAWAAMLMQFSKQFVEPELKPYLQQAARGRGRAGTEASRQAQPRQQQAAPAPAPAPWTAGGSGAGVRSLAGSSWAGAAACVSPAEPQDEGAECLEDG